MSSGHAALVTRQFGARAEAYVESSVHAQGADLDQAAALLQGQNAARVLDLGCGGGHVSFCAAPLVAEVTAYDLSADMLAAVARVAAERGFTNITTKQGRAETLPFPDAHFDFVLSRYSAHHWHGFGTALVEAHRVLRPGGRPCSWMSSHLAPACSIRICKASNSSAILRMCATIRSPNGWTRSLRPASR